MSVEKNNKWEYVKVFFSLNLFRYYPPNYIIFVHCNFRFVLMWLKCAESEQVKRLNYTNDWIEQTNRKTAQIKVKMVIVLVNLLFACRAGASHVEGGVAQTVQQSVSQSSATSNQTSFVKHSLELKKEMQLFHIEYGNKPENSGKHGREVDNCLMFTSAWTLNSEHTSLLLIFICLYIHEHSLTRGREQKTRGEWVKTPHTWKQAHTKYEYFDFN